MMAKHKNYVSEFSVFLNELKEKNPHIEEGQKNGRALLWDRPPINLTEAELTRSSTVAVNPYAYITPAKKASRADAEPQPSSVDQTS